MITCQQFRNSFARDSQDATLLAHLRSCDACLDHASAIDPDVIFRSLGGSELIPPGGLDLFVDDVMRQVRVREAERGARSYRALSWRGRMAIAAAVAGIAASATFFIGQRHDVRSSQQIAMARPASTRPATLVTRPVIDTYDSSTATIVEVPSEGANDVQVVMVFDEKLPADL